MKRQRTKDPFEQLSAEEKAHYGNPEDWELQGYVGPRSPAGESAQFSLRVPADDLMRLRSVARERGMTFSALAREALVSYSRSSALAHPAAEAPAVRISSSRGLVVYVSSEFTPDRTGYGGNSGPSFEVLGENSERSSPIPLSS